MATPTTAEKLMQPNDLIVSKTDTKGYVTYCNDAFMIFSGYYEEEILGKTHDILLHPDMPKSLFRQLTNTVNAENEFIGFIKKSAEERWLLLESSCCDPQV